MDADPKPWIKVFFLKIVSSKYSSSKYFPLNCKVDPLKMSPEMVFEAGRSCASGGMHFQTMRSSSFPSASSTASSLQPGGYQLYRY
jgi:hypothetical protein